MGNLGKPVHLVKASHSDKEVPAKKI